MENLTIAIACGGTGGHTFPGLATGRVLRGRGHRVVVLRAGRSIEERTFSGWDGETFETGARSPVRRHPVASALSLLRAWGWFARERPDVLLAMGSYASLAPGVAARLRRVPMVLHEANAVPGKAIVRLSRWASAAAIAFPGAGGELRGRCEVVRTGLPVRAELLGQSPPEGFAGGGGFTVLVTGGSQGAHVVNVLASKVLSGLAGSRAIKGLRIIHQTGPADEEHVRRRYEEAGADAKVCAFLDEMGGAMKAADFAIARSGAATCAELCLFGLPALLVPLPGAVRDHQYANARFMADAGAAEVARQEDLSEKALGDLLRSLASGDRARLRAMRGRCAALAAPDAAGRLADLVERCAARGRRG